MATFASPAACGDDRRPGLILVAVDMGRHLGSEPGKAWHWACTLARHYRLHIITAPAVAERCRGEDVAADWTWHVTRAAQPTTMGLAYYRDYARWCADVPGVVDRVVADIGPLALHHITLGSFRVLPRYDRCGITYSLGPLGGGEAMPWGYLRTARLPVRAWAAEAARPWLNTACAAVPRLRAVVSGSRLALATTHETESVLRRMGARRTGVVFPDRLPPDVAAVGFVPAPERAADLPREIRLIWSGRALWWKGGQLAVELLRRLGAAGVKARLTIFSYGPALEAWRRQAERAGVAGRCTIQGFVARPELLAAFGRAHGFVYPTLHDSSSSALLEAGAMGLPSFSVGVGGPAVVATPQTGYNARLPDLDAWLDGAIACVRAWQRSPETWVAASDAARARAAEFGAAHLDAAVAAWLSPRAMAA